MIGPDDEVNAPLIELLRGGGVILGGDDYDRARMTFLVPRLRSKRDCQCLPSVCALSER